MTDDFRARMLKIAEDLQLQGVSRYTTAPPVYRLAWRLGLNVRPPLYASFGVNALRFGLSFGALFLVVARLRAAWLGDQHAFSSESIAGTAAGIAIPALLFGLFMAAFIKRRARNIQLPPL